MDKGYGRTLSASYLGYVSQAIINNLAPLLFVIFRNTFGLSLSQIGFLVTYNFCMQIFVDLLAARFAERIGYKKCIVAAHFFCAAGLVCLGVLPRVMPDPYLGLLTAITVYSAGGALIEVLVSPIVEALPLDGKSGAMSLLHSFYCWGHALVVVLSTLFLSRFGAVSWPLLAALWAVVPFGNAFLYMASPVLTLRQTQERMPMKKLFRVRIFWLFVVLMICSGASEQAMGQWSSYFAETGLGVGKTLGDLLGPCMFAVLMGTARVVYSAVSNRISLKQVLIASGLLCIISYLTAVAAPHPVLRLIGCALTGLSVGVMWPGVFSTASQRYPRGATTMFALLALAGDVGCASGPSLVGLVSDLLGGDLRFGILAALVFPTVLVMGIFFLGKMKNSR